MSSGGLEIRSSQVMNIHTPPYNHSSKLTGVDIHGGRCGASERAVYRVAISQTELYFAIFIPTASALKYKIVTPIHLFEACF